MITMEQALTEQGRGLGLEFNAFDHSHSPRLDAGWVLRVDQFSDTLVRRWDSGAGEAAVDAAYAFADALVTIQEDRPSRLEVCVKFELGTAGWRRDTRLLPVSVNDRANHDLVVIRDIAEQVRLRAERAVPGALA